MRALLHGQHDKLDYRYKPEPGYEQTFHNEQKQQEYLEQMQRQQMQQQPEIIDSQPDEGYSDLPPAMPGSHSVNQDPTFMKWLFSFRKEVIVPLRQIWMGYRYNLRKEEWELPTESYPIMNEEGISWGISLIESYISPVYIVSNFSMSKYNYTMREVCNFVWNNLCSRYDEFGLKKLDIPRVANEIESKISAILQGTLYDGFREFLSKQYHVQEVQSYQNNNNEKSSNPMSSIMGLFKSPQHNMRESF